MSRPRLPTATEILPYLERIDQGRWYSNFGPLVQALERRLAERFGPQAHVVTAVNATQALTLALQAMHLPPGALCAVPAWTFVATAHAVAAAGLTPWFLDVTEEDWALTSGELETQLASAPGPVAAVVVVAPFGRAAPVDAWLDLQRRTGLAILIDAAAGFDTARDPRIPTVVSLHATKVLGAGEGGFLATDDASLAGRVRELTTYGFRGSREAQVTATNAKLSEYGAAVGLAALDRWEVDRVRWMAAAQAMRIALAGLGQVSFQPGWGVRWITSVCVVSFSHPVADRVAAGLHERGVDSRAWWGKGCHASPAFGDLPRTDLSRTERLAASTLGLPFAIDLTTEDVSRLADALCEALSTC